MRKSTGTIVRVGKPRAIRPLPIAAFGGMDDSNRFTIYDGSGNVKTDLSDPGYYTVKFASSPSGWPAVPDYGDGGDADYFERLTEAQWSMWAVARILRPGIYRTTLEYQIFAELDPGWELTTSPTSSASGHSHDYSRAPVSLPEAALDIWQQSGSINIATTHERWLGNAGQPVQPGTEYHGSGDRSGTVVLYHAITGSAATNFDLFLDVAGDLSYLHVHKLSLVIERLRDSA